MVCGDGGNREFSRLQKNLMDLLQEQKYELDNLREKGEAGCHVTLPWPLSMTA